MSAQLLNTLVGVFISFLCLSSAGEIKTKICSLHNDDACEQLSRSLELACNKNFHRVDCILNVNNSITQIGLIQPEEALLAAPLVSDNVVVIAEVQKVYGEPYQTVVVVKKDFNGSFRDLKGKTYCHPGFSHDSLLSRLVLEELEDKIITPKDICTNDSLDKTTLAERRIRFLSSFFGPSCRPGPWTSDSSLDERLRSKYSSLCELCGFAKCNVEYKVPFNDSLRCLINNKADIAITSVSHLKNVSPDYKLLCKDGTFRDLKSPCTWTNQLHDIIIADGKTANESQTLLKKYLSGKGKSGSINYHEYLSSILNIEKRSTVNYTDIQTLKKYVSARREIPKLDDHKMCNISMRWCTQSPIEQEKCKWLSQASLNYGIQPVVKCVPYVNNTLQSTELACLTDLYKKTSDLFTLSTSNAYGAARYNFKSIAYPETDTRYVYAIEIVLKNNTNVTKISDLKYQRACIPDYGGKEWLAFIQYLRNNGLVNRNDNFGKSLGDFVGTSCIPGSQIVPEINDPTKQKFCSNCVPKYNTQTAKYCNADEKNKYYGNDGALQCLLDGKGDYAVVTSIQIKNNSTARYVLCRNSSVSRVRGTDVDEDCALSVIVASEVVSQANNPSNADFVLALRDFEEIFGSHLEKPFSLFEVFNGTKDLLFKDSTPGIRFSSSDSSTSDNYIDNLKGLLRNIDPYVPLTTTTSAPQTTTPGGCSCLSSSTIFVLGAYAINLFIKKFM